jgi:hypothetical protein
MIVEYNVKDHNFFLDKREYNLSTSYNPEKVIKKWYHWKCNNCNISLITLLYSFNIIYIPALDDFFELDYLYNCNEVIIQGIII